MRMFNDLVQVSFQREKIWGEKAGKCLPAFIMFQQFVHGAKSQYERVENNLLSLEKRNVMESPNIIRALFLDTFYFYVSMGKIDESLRQVASIDNDTDLLRLIASKRDYFGLSMTRRGHLEHVERFLTGRFMSDFSIAKGKSYTLGGMDFDLDEMNLPGIRELYDHTVTILLSRVKREEGMTGRRKRPPAKRQVAS